MDPRGVERVGPYEVRRFIDEGAFAWVFEVVDPKFSGRRLALKMLKPDAARGEEFRRFQNEANWLAGIDDPNIVTIFDFGQDEATGNFFYTMTYVDGMTLRDRLKEGPLSINEAVDLFCGLLDGLQKIHEKNLVHRDIKPANVLLDRHGRGRLSDLGIAREQTEASGTRTGTAVGTALYMSPEQARGKPVDARSDLFSLALTLYECLTGNVIYDHVESIDSTSGMEVLLYIGSLVIHKNELDVVFPRETPVPNTLKAFIRKSLRVERDERPPDAATMKEELLEAIRSPTVEPTRPWPFIAGGIGAAALLGVFLTYQQVVVPQREAARANELFETARTLEESATEMLETAKDIEPAPSDAVLTQVEANIARASLYVLDGEEDIASEFYPSAVTNLMRAQRNMLDACTALNRGFLGQRASLLREMVGAETTRLDAAGATELSTAKWTELQALTARLAPPADGADACTASEANLGAIGASSDAALMISAIDSDIAAGWPRLADAAHSDALKARDQASAEALDAPELQQAIRTATRELVQGEIAQSDGRHREARDRYVTALDSYRAALAIVPAARARAQAQGLIDPITDSGNLGPAADSVAAAEQAMQAGNWDEAEKRYLALAEELRGMQAENTLRSAAIAARASADERRAAAIEAGAELSAAELLEAAEQRHREAVRQLEDGDLRNAEQGFAAAREQFSQARAAAISAVREASDRGDEARERSDVDSHDDCDRFGDMGARKQCMDAATALDAGDAAVAALDAPTALRRYQGAMAALEKADEAEADWERTRPRAPELVDRRPRRARIELAKGQAQNFSVSARDANGDSLRYAWDFGGERLDARGPDLEERFRRSGTLRAVVSDGTGQELIETWEIITENLPPTLSVSPARSTVTIEPGEVLRVLAVARDPDGDELTTRYLLDGREVATGDFYSFEAASPGEFTLRIVTADEEGAEAATDRRIEVATAEPDPELVLRAPTPTLRGRAPEPAREIPRSAPPRSQVSEAVAAPPALHPEKLPDLDGWRGTLVQALRAYRDALEGNDLAGLQGVYPMEDSSPIRAFYERKFKRGDHTEVELRLVGDIKGNGRSATVAFDQTETTPSRSRTYRYVATMRLGDRGRWQMERRERRQ